MAQQKLIIDQADAPEANEKKKRKAPLILAGIGIIAMVPIIGSTFAASISLGSGNVEFGQGTRTAAACDSSIGVSLAATVSSADFTDTTLTLTDLNTTACAGKTITIRIADASNALLGIGASSATFASFTIPSTFAASITGTGATVTVNKADGTAQTAHATDNQAVIDFSSTVSPASVSKVLLESTN